MNTKTWLNDRLPWVARLGRWKAALAAPAVVLVVLVIWLAGASGADQSAGGTPLFEVVRGPLTISVTESGTIKSQQQEVVKNEVEGNVSILWLIPEGNAVQPGDLLIDLDSSSLVDTQTKQQLTVLSAKTAHIRAEEEMKVVESQAASDVEKAELDRKFAQIDLQKYVEGEYPKLLQQAQSDITLADEELTKAQTQLKWSKTLAAESYITPSELESDVLAFHRSELKLAMSKLEKEVLEGYTHQRDLAQLESDVKQTLAALERAKLKANADITQAQADLDAKKSEYERQQAELAKIVLQLDKCKLRAPVAGTVVYATTGQPPWRGRGPLEEGRQVREREDLIYLPTATAMKAEVKIHEASMSKIRVGLPARLTVDALPGRTFTGRVEKVSFIPDAQSSWLNPELKVYNTEVYVDGDGSELRPGMTCRAEIVFEQLPDVVYVPVSAVVRIRNQPTVYVMEGGVAQAKPVEIGLDNNRMVVIKSGLKPGQRVLLAPPLPDTSSESAEPMDMTGTPAAPVTPATAPAATTAPGAPLEATSQPAVGGTGRPGPVAGAGGTMPSAEDIAAAQKILQEAGIDPAALMAMSREERRARMESLTPEQREALMKLFPRRPGGSGGQGRPDGGTAGQRGTGERGVAGEGGADGEARSQGSSDGRRSRGGAQGGAPRE